MPARVCAVDCFYHRRLDVLTGSNHICRGWAKAECERLLPAGRAIVEVTFERQGDAGAFVDSGGGGGKPLAQVVLELDGYSAPITAGNFVANVMSGAYDGATLSIGGETISVTSDKLRGASCRFLLVG